MHPQKQTSASQEVEQSAKILSQESLILNLIIQNDLEGLKELGVQNSFCNLNYLEPYVELEIDTKISPLICACSLGRIEIVKMLIANENLDIDLASEDQNQTPLDIAASTGNYEILKMLLEYGAEVNKPNAFNQTPIICSFQRLEEVQEQFYYNIQEKNVFENRKICFKMAELLLVYGADINWIVDKTHGYTMLMQLCSIKMDLGHKEKEINLDIVKFLIENGAKKDMKSSKGKGLIQLSKKHTNRDKIQELINNTRQINFYNQKPILKSIQIQQNNKAAQYQDHKAKKWIQYLPFCNK